MGDLLKVSAPSTPPTSVDSGGTVLTLSTLAAASSFVRVGAALVSGFTGITGFVYVSPSGDDTTGARNSLALPCQTIAQALTISSAGDTIFLAPGTYTENVAWSERRSLLGSGSRQSIISGTFTLTAPANNSAQTLNISDVQVTGAGALNFAAKTGGDVYVEMRGCVLGASWTHSRAAAGAYALAVYSTRQTGGTLICNFDNVILEGSEINAVSFTANAGSEQLRFTACVIPTVTINGAGTTAKIAGSIIAAAITFSDNFGGVLTTTGCDMRAAAITINSGTWYEYGCTFTQSSVAGASTNKRVSFQRKASTTCAGGGTTTITLPIPLGATDYHVSATPTGSGSAGTAPDWYITNKTGTTFDVVVTTDFDTPLEFGIFYRVA